jgi:thioredoxin 2
VEFSRLESVVRCGSCKTELPRLASPIEIIDEESFESLMAGSSLPVLADFWADWCGPCKMMSPELSKVASNSGGKFIVAKVNTEGVPALAQRFRISALPTLMVFKDGAEIGRAEGARPAVEIQRFVERSIRVV